MSGISLRLVHPSAARTSELRSDAQGRSLMPRLLLRLGVELALLAVTATAQQQQIPHAGYVYPAGGRQGTSFEVIVGGQFLDGVKTALLSGAGVQATVVDHFKPLTPAQAAQLRDQAKELSEKPNPTAEDRRDSRQTAGIRAPSHHPDHRRDRTRADCARSRRRSRRTRTAPGHAQ